MEELRTSMNTETAEEQKVDNRKDSAHIVFDEPIPFKANADVKYLSSISFLQEVSTVMHSAYADFEGCKLVPMKDGNCYIIFYFNHNVYPEDTDKIIACTAESPSIKAKNNTLRAIRLADSYRTNGEKYYLTDDGKSSIADLLIPGNLVFEPSGAVKWNKVVADVADPQHPAYMYGPRGVQVLTAVSYIDPSRIASLMYGDGRADDSSAPQWEYVVKCHNSLMPNRGQFGQIYGGMMLSITKISVEETNRLARDLGFQQAPGLDIIR
jgi:hypothetical protein